MPRSRVPDLLHAIHEIGDRRGMQIGVFGHAGDGNLHPSFVFDRDDPTAPGAPAAGPGRPLPGHAGARRLGHRRARDRRRQAVLARGDARSRRGPRDAGHQGGPRSARDPQSRQGALGSPTIALVTADPRVLVAVDLGTSAVKAGVLSPDGRLRGFARVPYALLLDGAPGRAEQRPRRLVDRPRPRDRHRPGPGRGRRPGRAARHLRRRPGPDARRDRGRRARPGAGDHLAGPAGRR